MVINSVSSRFSSCGPRFPFASSPNTKFSVFLNQKESISDSSQETSFSNLDVCHTLDSNLTLISRIFLLAQVDQAIRELSTLFENYKNLLFIQKLVLALHYINLISSSTGNPTEVLNKKKNFFSALSSLKVQDKNHRMTYFHRNFLDNTSSSTYIFFRLIKDLESNANALLIEATESQILDAYIKYNGLILLRPLKSERLMLGCGLGTCSLDNPSHSIPKEFDLRHKSVHREFDTIDMELSMNPSIVCTWGNLSQCAIFQDRYSIICDESNVCLWPSPFSNLQMCLDQSLKKNGYYAIVKLEEDLESVNLHQQLNYTKIPGDKVPNEILHIQFSTLAQGRKIVVFQKL